LTCCRWRGSEPARQLMLKAMASRLRENSSGRCPRCHADTGALHWLKSRDCGAAYSYQPPMGITPSVVTDVIIGGYGSHRGRAECRRISCPRAGGYLSKCLGAVHGKGTVLR